MGCPQSKKRKRRAQRSNKEQQKLSRSALKKQIKAKAKLEKALAETKAKGDAELRAAALAVAGLGGVQLPAITSEQIPEQTPEQTPEQSRTTTTTNEQTLTNEHTSIKEIQKEEKEMKSVSGLMTTDASVAAAITDAVAEVIGDDAVSKSEDLKAILGINQSTLASERPNSSTSVEPRLIIVGEADICVDTTKDEPATSTPQIKAPIVVIPEVDNEASMGRTNVEKDLGTKDGEDKDEHDQEDDKEGDKDEHDQEDDKEGDKDEHDKDSDEGKDDKTVDEDSSSLELEAANLVKAVFAGLDKDEEKAPQSEVLNTAADDEISAAEQAAILEQEAAYLVDAVFASLEGEDSDEDDTSTTVTVMSVGMSAEAPSNLVEEAAKVVSSVLAQVTADFQSEGRTTAPIIETADMQMTSSLDIEAAKLVDACLASITQEDLQTASTTTAVQMSCDETKEEEEQHSLDRQAADMVDILLATIATEQMASNPTDAISSTASVDPAKLTNIILNGLKNSSVNLARQTSEMSTQTCEMAIQTDNIENEQDKPSKKPSAVSKIKTAIKSASQKSRTALLGKKDKLDKVKKASGKEKEKDTQASSKSKTKLADSRKPTKDTNKSKSDHKKQDKQDKDKKASGKDKDAKSKNQVSGTNKTKKPAKETKNSRSNHKKSPTASKKKPAIEPKARNASSRMLKLKESAKGADSKECANAKTRKTKLNSTSTGSKAVGSKSKQTATKKSQASKIPQMSSTSATNSNNRNKANPAEKLKASKSSSLPHKGGQQKPNTSVSAAITSHLQGSSHSNSQPAEKQDPDLDPSSVTNHPTKSCDNSTIESKSLGKLKPGHVRFQEPQSVTSSPSIHGKEQKSTTVESKDANIALTSADSLDPSKLSTKRQKRSGKDNVSIKSEGAPRRVNSARQARSQKTSLAMLAEARPSTVVANQMESTTITDQLSFPGSDESAMGDNFEVTREISVTHQLSLENQPLDELQQHPTAVNSSNQEQQLWDQLRVLPLGHLSPEHVPTDQHTVSSPDRALDGNLSSIMQTRTIQSSTDNITPVLSAHLLAASTSSSSFLDHLDNQSTRSFSSESQCTRKSPSRKNTQTRIPKIGSTKVHVPDDLNQQDRGHPQRPFGKGSSTITTHQAKSDVPAADDKFRPTSQLKTSSSSHERASLTPRGKKTPSLMLQASNSSSTDLSYVANGVQLQIPLGKGSPTHRTTDRANSDLLIRADTERVYRTTSQVRMSSSPQGRASLIPRGKKTPSQVPPGLNSPSSDLLSASEAGGSVQGSRSPCGGVSESAGRDSKILPTQRTPSPLSPTSNKPSQDLLNSSQMGHRVPDSRSLSGRSTQEEPQGFQLKQGWFPITHPVIS
ncbi:microtubule-associated protein futsch-like [Acanthaster planci]|uniref:Microtubule-associated protein futsch-like n=1 Tax=Acanthaster planci TaxID=133434 RepID=A0A8B7ZYM8_ACAPL|nr:microtubule-associated protein futsch-like [Acanthaster planci]